MWEGCWRSRRGLPPCGEATDVALLDTPERLDLAGYKCGPVALAIHYRYWYPKRPLPTWGELVDPLLGFGVDCMLAAVRKEFPYFTYGEWELETLQWYARRTPVICLVNAGEADHW